MLGRARSLPPVDQTTSLLMRENSPGNDSAGRMATRGSYGGRQRLGMPYPATQLCIQLVGPSGLDL